ncbi:hypothetical protein AB4059_04025 [Lysobacter sp. 2RAF19]
MMGRILAGLIALWICFGFFRSAKAGVIPFSHDPRLAVRRSESPIFFWVYAAVIVGVIVFPGLYAGTGMW